MSEDIPCTSRDALQIARYPYYSPVPLETTTFGYALARILWVLNAATQEAAAEILGVQVSSFSDADQRQTIPNEWLVRLQLGWNISPLWILTGWVPPVRPGLLDSEELEKLMRLAH